MRIFDLKLMARINFSTSLICYLSIYCAKKKRLFKRKMPICKLKGRYQSAVILVGGGSHDRKQNNVTTHMSPVTQQRIKTNPGTDSFMAGEKLESSARAPV